MSSFITYFDTTIRHKSSPLFAKRRRRKEKRYFSGTIAGSFREYRGERLFTAGTYSALPARIGTPEAISAYQKLTHQQRRILNNIIGQIMLKSLPPVSEYSLSVLEKSKHQVLANIQEYKNKLLTRILLQEQTDPIVFARILLETVDHAIQPGLELPSSEFVLQLPQKLSPLAEVLYAVGLCTSSNLKRSDELQAIKKSQQLMNGHEILYALIALKESKNSDLHQLSKMLIPNKSSHINYRIAVFILALRAYVEDEKPYTKESSFVPFLQKVYNKLDKVAVLLGMDDNQMNNRFVEIASLAFDAMEHPDDLDPYFQELTNTSGPEQLLAIKIHKAGLDKSGRFQQDELAAIRPDRLAAFYRQVLEDYTAQGGDRQKLAGLLASNFYGDVVPSLRTISHRGYAPYLLACADRLVAAYEESKANASFTIQDVISSLDELSKAGQDPAMLLSLLNIVPLQKGQKVKVPLAGIARLIINDLGRVAQYTSLTEEEKLARCQAIISANLNFLKAVVDGDPVGIMTTFMLNRNRIPYETIQRAYAHWDTAYIEGKGVIPEMMALLPYFELTIDDILRPRVTDSNIAEIRQIKAKMIESASKAITFQNWLYRARIHKIEHEVLVNWGRIGIESLSSIKQKYEAMTRWKGIRGEERPSILESCGKFKRIAPRPDDYKYGPGYLYEKLGRLSIELRRAYKVISHPDYGTLVIRNSSVKFGRDTLDEVAYFAPNRYCSSTTGLFSPLTEIADQETESDQSKFFSVIGKEINLNSVREANHQKIKALKDAYDSVMDRYADWKSDVILDGQGKPVASEGLKLMLDTAYQAMQASDPESPAVFTHQAPLMLAWVPKTKLPYPVSVLDLSLADNLDALGLLIQELKFPGTISCSDDGIKSMRPAIDFINNRPARQYELMLMEKPQRKS